MDRKRKTELIQTLLENNLSERYSSGEAKTKDSDIAKIKYNYALRKIINNYFDIHEMEVTGRELQQEITSVIMDLNLIGKSGETNQSSETIRRSDGVYPPDSAIDEEKLLEVFEEKINTIKEDIGRSDPTTYTIWFPWHVHWKNEPNTFQVYDLSIERAGDYWKDKIESLAYDPDAPDGGYISEEIQEGEYEVWMTEVTAKSPHYAFIEFKNGLQLLSGRINHSLLNLDLQPLAERQNRLPHQTLVDARWSDIRLPFAMLWEDDRSDETVGVDRGFQGCNVYTRGGLPKVEVDYENLKTIYENHPRYIPPSATEATILHDALIDYQRGLTTESHTESFLNFWRVIEELSLADQGQKRDIIERARFALNVVTANEYDPIIDEIADEIRDVRNNWVHDAGWNSVAETQEKVLKILADAMINFHASHVSDLEREKVRRVFKWATESELKRTSEANAIREVSDLLP